LTTIRSKVQGFNVRFKAGLQENLSADATPIEPLNLELLNGPKSEQLIKRLERLERVQEFCLIEIPTAAALGLSHR